MEQIYKRILANRQALLHKRYIENLIVASNCLGTTARLTDAKPKAITENNSGQEKAHC